MCVEVFMSPKLSVIALSIVPPIALLSRIYGRYVQNITKQVQDSLAAATQVTFTFFVWQLACMSRCLSVCTKFIADDDAVFAETEILTTAFYWDVPEMSRYRSIDEIFADINNFVQMRIGYRLFIRGSCGYR